MRSAWKEDLNTTSAKLVFGESLRLFGQFLKENSNNPEPEAADFLNDLREHFRKLRPISRTKHRQKTTFLFKDLETTSRVFIRRDKLKAMFGHMRAYSECCTEAATISTLTYADTKSL